MASASARDDSDPGATAEHVEVTNGGSEANFVTMWHLVEPGEMHAQVPGIGAGVVHVLHPRLSSCARQSRSRTRRSGTTTIEK